jgi:small subunit ribosomal protein S1
MTENIKQEQEISEEISQQTVTKTEPEEKERDEASAAEEIQEDPAEPKNDPVDDESQEDELQQDESQTQSEEEIESSEEAEEDKEDNAEESESEEEPEEAGAEEIPTFTGDMDEGEKMYSYNELEQASEDYSDEEFYEFAELYESTLTEINEKEIVTARVVSVNDDFVIVDIGFKSEGIIQANEFPNDVVEKLAPGDEIDVFLDQIEDREGQLILSRRKADILHAWNALQRSYDDQEIVEGYINRRIKGGMVVDIMGIEAFLPGSQIDVRPVRDFDAYVGKTMEFQVVKLNMHVENVVVSHRALIESDLEEQREKILATIEEGQVLQGIVKNITDFGVFIDLGGVDGLLHITDLSWGRVEHPSEILSLDQKVNVAVIDYDEESKRVSLGLKQLEPQPWDDIDLKYPEGMKVQGRVVSIADYGAFIELEKGVEGLIHISEMSWTQHIKHPSLLVSRDDIIECVVLDVSPNERKISLGIKQLKSDPWEDIGERYPVGSKHEGRVRNLTNFGVFVELEPGIDGLVHISDLSWTQQVNHPSEMVEQDQDIEVVILAIDFENRRITLGHKQVERNPWEAFHEEYGLTAEVKGTVSKVTPNGIFMNLPHELEGFIPGSKTEGIKNHQDLFKVGDDISAYVIEFDEERKNITLSQREDDIEGHKPEATEQKTKEDEKPETGNLTFGEMSGLAEIQKEMEKKEKEEVKRKIEEHRQKEQEEQEKPEDQEETEAEEEAKKTENQAESEEENADKE